MPKQGCIIHHKDGDKRNNDIANLEEMLEELHKKHHAPKPVLVEITCAYCAGKSQKKRKDVKHKVKYKGQKDFYCNRVCMAKHYGRGRSKPK